MTNMSQFTDNIDEISFVESSSIYDDTDISTNVSICEKETDPVDPLFNQHIPLWGRQVFTVAKTQCSNSLNRYGDLRVFTAAKN